MFNPKFHLTHSIVKMLTTIAEARSIIARARLLPKQELRLRRQARIRMSHSSTSIEGNVLNLRQVEAVVDQKKIDAPERDIYEVKNYLKALQFIDRVVKEKKPISEKIILRVHKLVTHKTLRPEASGQFRNGPVYVVKRSLDGRQEIVYTAAPAKNVPQLMIDLITWIRANEGEDIHPALVAGIVHQKIAAIHPFFDGNGRTARALATLILYQRGYDFRHLFALEDYYNMDRPAYYAAINIGKSHETRRLDFTPWLEYFVKGFKEEIERVRHQVLSLAVKKVDAGIDTQLFLDKEQVTILDFLDTPGKITVRDVIDIIQCPRRTTQLHLQKLTKLKMIERHGKGRATYYTLKK